MSSPEGLFDRVSIQVTRLAGLALCATGSWSALSAPAEHLLWGSVMVMSGIALMRAYLPVLRIVAFALLFFAGLVILGGLSPFAAMDMSSVAREAPGMELRRIVKVLSLSAALVAASFCIEHARKLKRAQQRQQRADPRPEPLPPSADAR